MPDSLLFLKVAAAASIVCLPIGMILLASGGYHSWQMFMHRSGDWRGYYLPLGFLIDATLDADGLRHRKKAGIFLAWAAPFLLVGVLPMALFQD
jgi:hypothetical protein